MSPATTHGHHRCLETHQSSTELELCSDPSWDSSMKPVWGQPQRSRDMASSTVQWAEVRDCKSRGPWAGGSRIWLAALRTKISGGFSPGALQQL